MEFPFRVLIRVMNSRNGFRVRTLPTAVTPNRTNNPCLSSTSYPSIWTDILNWESWITTLARVAASLENENPLLAVSRGFPVLPGSF